MPSLAILSAASNDRVSRGWRELLARESWHFFCNLTYGEIVIGYEKIERDVRRWARAAVIVEAARRGLVELRPVVRRDGYGHEIDRALHTEGACRRDVDRRPAVWIAGIERQRRGALHAHVLLRVPGWLATMDPWSLIWAWYLPDVVWRVATRRTFWDDEDGQRKARGYAFIERPQSQGDVAGYVSKYVCKGGELVISEGFRAVQLPRVHLESPVQVAPCGSTYATP